MQRFFTQIAKVVTHWAGSPIATIVAFALVVLWIIGGFFLGFSDTYQLIINTGTTIVTFLMVFLIQNTQNRDTGALQIKLDEIIRATKGAHNALLDLEELSEEELTTIRDRYEKLAHEAREALRKGKFDVDTPELQEVEEKATEIEQAAEKDLSERKGETSDAKHRDQR